MTKQGAKTATPRLRFPDFRVSEGWSTERMDRLYSFGRNNILSRDKLNYVEGTAKNIHYGDIHTKFPATFDVSREQVPFVNQSEALPEFASGDYCIEGDLVFADASEDMNDVGKTMEIVRLHGEQVLAGQHTILARQRGNTLVTGFGAYLFGSGLMRGRIKKEAQGTKVFQISASRLGGIDVTYPSDKAEQQKIAECLTSLDEVIAAQGRKVEALKAHKRGLMQQLFPREGETRPRLRFPEFRSAPVWRAKGLNKLAKIRTGRKDANEGAVDGVYPFFTCAENHIYSRSYSFDSEAILIAGNANVGQAKYYNGKFEAYQRTYVLTDFSDVFVPYLYQFLDANLRPTLLAQVQTSAMSYIRLPMLEDFQVALPPSIDEQQRIAECFSSLDTQIAAEAEQLTVLKTHKQGLMQQLFPAAEASGA